MQPRLVKTIRATLITRIDVYESQSSLTEDERKSLGFVAENLGSELPLRQAGLSPAEIRRLQFLRWRVSS